MVTAYQAQAFASWFKPKPPESSSTQCECPHCKQTFSLEEWDYFEDAFYCEDCEYFHAGLVCPNPKCAEVIGAAGHLNGYITCK